MRKVKPNISNDSRDEKQAIGPLFVNASRMARRRRFSEALSLVRRANAEGHCTSWAALDLMGKIYAQQGRYVEADACWRKAQSTAPGGMTSSAALSRLQKKARPYRRWIQLTKFCFPVFAFLMFAVISTAILVNTQRMSNQREEDIAELTGEFDELRNAMLTFAERNDVVLDDLVAERRALEKNLIQLQTLVVSISEKQRILVRAADQNEAAVASLQAEFSTLRGGLPLTIRKELKKSVDRIRTERSAELANLQVKFDADLNQLRAALMKMNDTPVVLDDETSGLIKVIPASTPEDGEPVLNVTGEIETARGQK